MADLKMVAYWATLGAAAGGLGGVVVGGLGGRLAMFVLRLTSGDYVIGVESDDGFTIGRFDLSSTASLLLVTAIMGSVVGLVVVLGRPFFPARFMPGAWGVAGALVGGALLVHQDGIDFNLLEPAWLAVGLFVAVPALGAAAIAALVGWYPRFWWKRRVATAVAGLVALPSLVLLPMWIMTALVGFGWALVLRFDRARGLARWRPARIAAWVVFGGIVTLGAIDLLRDVRALVL